MAPPALVALNGTTGDVTMTTLPSEFVVVYVAAGTTDAAAAAVERLSVTTGLPSLLVVLTGALTAVAGTIWTTRLR